MRYLTNFDMCRKSCNIDRVKEETPIRLMSHSTRKNRDAAWLGRALVYHYQKPAIHSKAVMR